MAKLFSGGFLNNFNAFLANHLHRKFHNSLANMIKVGEQIPSVNVFETKPENAINVFEFCKNKKIVLFGLPGAFTPGCTKTQLPGYVERYFEIRKKGIDEVICIAVNDTFVMDAWGKEKDAIGKIRMFADPDATFTKSIGMDFYVPKLGGIRSKRYAMIIDKGIVSFVTVEPDNVGLTCTLATKLPL